MDMVSLRKPVTVRMRPPSSVQDPRELCHHAFPHFGPSHVTTQYPESTTPRPMRLCTPVEHYSSRNFYILLLKPPLSWYARNTLHNLGFPLHPIIPTTGEDGTSKGKAVLSEEDPVRMEILIPSVVSSCNPNMDVGLISDHGFIIWILACNASKSSYIYLISSCPYIHPIPLHLTSSTPSVPHN